MLSGQECFFRSGARTGGLDSDLCRYWSYSYGPAAGSASHSQCSHQLPASALSSVGKAAPAAQYAQLLGGDAEDNLLTHHVSYTAATGRFKAAAYLTIREVRYYSCSSAQNIGN